MKNWNLIRIIRLMLGIYILIDGVYTRQWIFVVAGALFSLMPLLNIGCCVAGNCDMQPDNRKPEKRDADIVFEEIK